MPNCRTGVVFALISCCAEGSDASLTSSKWADPAPASNYDAEGMLHGQGKRHAAVSVMAAAVPAFLKSGDIYNFGVYTGGGLRAIVREFYTQQNLTFNHIWGFDSFVGLPDSNVALHSPTNARHGQWKAGDLNAADQLAKVLGTDAYNFKILQRHIIKHIGTEQVTLVKGFFNESLPRLSLELKIRMQPALLVDIDCDIYEGTVEGLEWLIANHLLVRGSFVYYDDWQVAGEGEVKAHGEVTKKHGLQWEDMRLSDACLVRGTTCFRQRLFRLQGRASNLDKA